jgi:Arc/MetJ family transcription regulator
MKTRVEIDAALLTEALRVTGARSKREVVERGLQLLVQVARQEELRQLRGKLKWDGDFSSSRSDV